MRKVKLHNDQIIVEQNKTDINNLTIEEVGKAYYATDGESVCKLHKVGSRPRNNEASNHYGWLLLHNSFGYYSYGYETIEEAIKAILKKGWKVRQIPISELSFKHLFENENP